MAKATRLADRALIAEELASLSRPQTAMSYFRRLAIGSFDLLRKTCVAAASTDINKEVARRDAERGRETFRWFTREEAAVAEALARIIVPSDKETPGMDEVCVLDDPAIITLDRLVAMSSHRQSLYSRGLLCFDLWARKHYQRKFAELPEGEQIALLKAAQQLWERRTCGMSAIKRAWRWLEALAQVRKGAFFAAELYPQIRSDCLRVFYTSRVSWVWLDYDGPPMDKGYPSVTSPRERSLS
jgi:hypothetical protein